jgi:hypothetical protein
MNAWRIYRLPGDRQWWQIDAIEDGKLSHADVLAFELTGPSRSVDVGGTSVPRAWIETQQEPRTLHFHKCKCGNVWQHWSDRGNETVHTCSACGTLVWEQANRHKLRDAGTNLEPHSDSWSLFTLLLLAAGIVVVIALIARAHGETGA